MVKELYVNEKLFVSINNNQIKPVLVGEQYRSVGPKELKSESYSFIKRFPLIMESLREGKVLKSTRDNSIIKSIIGEIETTNEFTKEETLKVLREATGYSFEESVENLEFALQKPAKAKQKVKGNK